MVSKSGLDLQRRDRSGPPRNLAPSDFFHVPAKPRQYRNSVPNLAAHGKCSRSRRLNRPKSSSEIALGHQVLQEEAPDPGPSKVLVIHDGSPIASKRQSGGSPPGGVPASFADNAEWT